MLLFDLGTGRNMAIPLSDVARLEKFPAGSVERSGTREVVQYRGTILPLLRLDAHLPGSGEANGDDGHLQTVVYNENGRSIGLVVSRIRDIVHEKVTLEHSTRHPLIVGSAVIQNRVTDLLDLPAIIRAGDFQFSNGEIQ